MTPEQAKIVEDLDFVVCEFGPDGDPCEACKATDQQLYFRGPDDSGQYFCLACILDEHTHNQRELSDLRFLELSHTSHCASRQVWGDGECECQKKGIIPGQISRMIVICGVGNHTGLIDAIRKLGHVAGVVLVDAAQEVKKAEFAFASLGESSAKIAASIATLKEAYADHQFERTRDYPTLREGIRRKTIKSLGKGRR